MHRPEVPGSLSKPPGSGINMTKGQLSPLGPLAFYFLQVSPLPYHSDTSMIVKTRTVV